MTAIEGLLFWSDLKHGPHPSTGPRRVCPLLSPSERSKACEKVKLYSHHWQIYSKGASVVKLHFFSAVELNSEISLRKVIIWIFLGSDCWIFLLSHRDDCASTVRIQANSMSPFGLKMAITNNWRVLIAYYPTLILHNILALFILKEEKHFLPGYITAEGKCSGMTRDKGRVFVLFSFVLMRLRE